MRITNQLQATRKSRAEKSQSVSLDRKRSRSGFTLIEIIVVTALLALLAGIAIPNYIASQTEAHKSACISNLKEISYAVQQWALEQKKTATSPVEFSDISPFLKGSVACPAGGKSFLDSYTLSTVEIDPSCARQPLNHRWMESTVVAAVMANQGGAAAVSAPGDSGRGAGNGGTESAGRRGQKEGERR